MRIALLQYPIAWADKETNLRQTEERIAALAGKADVAVLPEMFATGFCTDHPELAETMDGEIIRRLQAAADQSGVAIVSSFICAPDNRYPFSDTRYPFSDIRSPLPDTRYPISDVRAKLCNRGFMIKPSPITNSPTGVPYPIAQRPLPIRRNAVPYPIGGTPSNSKASDNRYPISDVQAKLCNRGFMIKPHQKPITDSEASDNRYPIEIQDKRHLYAHGGEDLFFQPAQKRHIFEYKGVKFLLLVCYDLRFPVWARNQSGYDYDILLVVANWPDIRIQYWDALIAARATENQCYIAAVNCVGDDGMGLHYNGHSVAYDTRLQPIVSFADDEEGTKIADFDIAALHHFREVLPLWKDVDHFEIKK